MTGVSDARIYQLKALTDLWTGSVTLREENGQIKEKTGADRLITTGLLGSIRWWFEVLVRGLGGHACDPTDTKCEGEKHCAVCELFGCTGWARKFRFNVFKRDDVKTDQIKRDHIFTLRFTPLRPIRNEEWTLLDTTLRLIADYGAIGGKTVFKPSDEPERERKLHHRDFGLVQVRTVLSQRDTNTRRNDLENYLSKWKKLNHGEFAWASLRHFWCVNGKYLSRENNNKSTFNQVLGRQQGKCQAQRLATDYCYTIAKWLAGSQGESKKVFSFRRPPRTFGFVNPGLKPELIDFDKMEEHLTKAWGQNGWKFFTGGEIMDQLFTGKEAANEF